MTLRGRNPILQCDTLALLLAALFFIYIAPSAVTVVLVLCALAYLVMDVIALALSRTAWVGRLTSVLQLAVIASAISLFVIAPTVLFMIRRAQSAPTAFAQDSLIQVEAAARFVLAGKNPYVENYLETPLADWEFSWAGLGTNPALHHFAYTPLAFLMAVPGEGILRPLTGWYDHRLVLLLSYAINLVLIKKLAGSRRQVNALLIVVGLNPLLMTAYTCGNLDAIVLTGWLCACLFAARQRWELAFLSLGFAVAVKQIAAVAVPFLFLYWLGTVQRRTLKAMLAPVVAFVVPLVFLIGPFFLWHPRAFVEDTVLFLVGGLPDSWPVSGMSVEALLPSDPAMTAFLSVVRWIVLVPVLALTGYLTWRLRSLRATLALQAVFFTVAIFFSRFVNVQYVGYLLVQLGLSLWVRESVSQARPDG